MRLSIFLLNSLLITTIFMSCGSGPQLMPNVSGKAGEIIVVMEKPDWEGACGTSLRGILAGEYPFLPQPEPLFTLVNIPANAFSSIFQSHRNIIIFSPSSEQTEAKILIRYDVWAAPQIVITVSGPDEASLAAYIEGNASMLRNSFEQAERNRIIQNAKKYEETGVRRAINAIFGGSPYFPKGYKIRKKSDTFVWVEYGTTYTTQGVFIYTYPYKDSLDLKVGNIVAMRNEVLKREVPGPLDNTYMTTNVVVEPSMAWIRYRKRQFAEVRGLWDVKNDFMGGPFVSHVFFDRDRQNIIVLEAFVYAPRYEKRNYLRQVEAILYSFEWDTDGNQ